MSFDRDVCAPIRALMGRRVRRPTGGAWSLTRDASGPVITLRLPQDQLGHNLQTDRAASPFFLLAFGFWHGLLTGTEPRLRLELTGEPPLEGKTLRHAHRAWIALEALQHGLGDRLEVTGLDAERWPGAPVLNQPVGARGQEKDRGGPEHQVEVKLSAEPRWAATCPLGPLTPFRRQLPLGLFDARVSNPSRWTPGGKAQADLWATSPDQRVFHLFELKVAGNAKVGALPELLAYLWLLHRARVGLPDGRRLEGGGPGAEAARRADRLEGWLLAPAVHPLLLHAGRSPLEWLELPVGLGMLFYRGAPGHFDAWVPEATWQRP